MDTRSIIMRRKERRQMDEIYKELGWESALDKNGR